MNRAPNTSMLLNTSIVEYDMKSANTSLMEYYKLVPQNIIDDIKKLEKDKRTVAVGLLCQKDKQLTTNLENAFNDMMTQFLDTNGLDIDLDVLCIKKDAAYIVSKVPEITTFGPVHFRPKGCYNSFIMLNQFEFYLSDTECDVKGLKDSDIHKDGILQLIRDILEYAVSVNNDRSKIFYYLSDLVNSYKRRELDVAYYREFNASSRYPVHMGDDIIMFDNITLSQLPITDIGYNYINIILPLMRAFM